MAGCIALRMARTSPSQSSSLDIVFPFSFASPIVSHADNDLQVEAAEEVLLSAVLLVDVVWVCVGADAAAEAAADVAAGGAAPT